MDDETCCHAAPKSKISLLTDKILLYRPLLILFAASFAGAFALQLRLSGGFTDTLMGLFLLFLAVLQLFDWRGFAVSFARYDLVAARFSTYARVYPFIEVALGLSYLANLAPVWTNALMFSIMTIGTAGVLRILRRAEKLQCACAGTAFALPVGWITVFENVVMGAMALMNLWRLLR